jgi:hypothetical protein
MNDQEFEDAIKKLREDHTRVMSSIEHMPPLSEEQKQKIAEVLGRQQRKYDEYLKRRAEFRSDGELAQAARRAAQQALTEGDAKHWQRSQPKSWRNLWIALAIGGAVLLLFKLRFH